MRNKQKGFSLIELLIVVAIILIIAAIAIPNLLRSRMSANEASAVGTLRTLNSVMVQYASTYTDINNLPCGFPPALANLGPGTPASNATADLVDGVLGMDPATKSGYVFTFTQPTQDTNGCGIDYTLNADPVTFNTTGLRTFFTDQSGVVRQRTDGTAAGVGDPPV